MPWLLKAEPNSRIVKGKDVKYTIDDLQHEKVSSWDGVRNNEARKHMCSMKVGDMAFFYRSNCTEPGIVGTMRVVKEAHPDLTAGDPNEPYYDAKNPDGKWVVVDFEYISHIQPPILLSAIKSEAKLQNMFLVKRSRLSVSPVTEDEWKVIMQMHETEATTEPSSKSETETETVSKFGTPATATEERKRERSRSKPGKVTKTAPSKVQKQPAISGPAQRRLRRHDKK